jgi:hypothetical protein
MAHVGNLEWPHIYADFVAKRDALNQVIATIATHFIKGATDGEDTSTRKTRRTWPRGRSGKPSPKPGRRSKRALKTERNGTERNGTERNGTERNGARTAPTRSAEPP